MQQNIKLLAWATTNSCKLPKVRLKLLTPIITLRILFPKFLLLIRYIFVLTVLAMAIDKSTTHKLTSDAKLQISMGNQ